MEFLAESRDKIVRTVLYGDQDISRWELEIMHTPIFQRLYDLKQLGFADRVYPDAVHSRFNHVLGVMEMATRMADRLRVWLEKHSASAFAYTSQLGETEISGGELRTHLDERRAVIRLMAMLHDITHAAYGHTLEDEVRLFTEKHDAPARQRRFFDALVVQLLYIWLIELRISAPDPQTLENLNDLIIDPAAAAVWAEQIGDRLSGEQRQQLATFLRWLELAMVLLTHIEFSHGRGQRYEEPVPLLIDSIASAVHPQTKKLPFDLHRDLYLIDMVGNTICADLLDYARRDARNAGLKVQFDERVIRYLAVVSVNGDLSPTRNACIRLAIQFFTDKMRHDVLSEMGAILKARYLISERIIFHPTKCAAGAMLGTAAQLLGLSQLPPWMQAIGDQEFLARLREVAIALDSVAKSAGSKVGKWIDAANELEHSPRLMAVVHSSLEAISRSENFGADVEPKSVERLRSRVAGARNLLWHLSARRYYKLMYRLRYGVGHSGGETDESIAKRYCEPGVRYDLERKIERLANLPVGSLVVHCPRWNTSMKTADVLVVGSDPNRVAKLRDVTDVNPEGLEPYKSEINAIEEMYRSIWQLHVYLDSAGFDKFRLVQGFLEQEVGFPNDALLKKELQSQNGRVYDIVEANKGLIAPDSLPRAIALIDVEVARARHSDDAAKELVNSVIRQVASETGRGTAEPGAPVELPGM